jgi:hypothetical protein
MKIKHWFIQHPFRWYSGEPFVFIGVKILEWDRNNECFTMFEFRLGKLTFSAGFFRY